MASACRIYQATSELLDEADSYYVSLAKSASPPQLGLCYGMPGRYLNNGFFGACILYQIVGRDFSLESAKSPSVSTRFPSRTCMLGFYGDRLRYPIFSIGTETLRLCQERSALVH